VGEDPYTFAPLGGESGLAVTARALRVIAIVRQSAGQNILCVHKATFAFCSARYLVSIRAVIGTISIKARVEQLSIFAMPLGRGLLYSRHLALRQIPRCRNRGVEIGGISRRLELRLQLKRRYLPTPENLPAGLVAYHFGDSGTGFGKHESDDGRTQAKQLIGRCARRLGFNPSKMQSKP